MPLFGYNIDINNAVPDINKVDIGWRLPLLATIECARNCFSADNHNFVNFYMQNITKPPVYSTQAEKSTLRIELFETWAQNKTAGDCAIAVKPGKLAKSYIGGGVQKPLNQSAAGFSADGYTVDIPCVFDTDFSILCLANTFGVSRDISWELMLYLSAYAQIIKESYFLQGYVVSGLSDTVVAQDAADKYVTVLTGTATWRSTQKLTFSSLGMRDASIDIRDAAASN